MVSDQPKMTESDVEEAALEWFTERTSLSGKSCRRR